METTTTKPRLSFAKIFGMVIVAAAVIMGVFIALGWYTYLNGPCAVPKVNAAIDQFHALAVKFDDASAVANSAPRMSLAGPIAEMQAISREMDAVPVPACMARYQETMHDFTQQRINAFMLFMRQAKDGEVQAAFHNADTTLAGAGRELNRIMQCAPRCE